MTLLMGNHVEMNIYLDIGMFAVHNPDYFAP